MTKKREFMIDTKVVGHEDATSKFIRDVWARGARPW